MYNDYFQMYHHEFDPQLKQESTFATIKIKFELRTSPRDQVVQWVQIGDLPILNSFAAGDGQKVLAKLNEQTNSVALRIINSQGRTIQPRPGGTYLDLNYLTND
jgi:hypothetical protein